ncbi:adenylate/guanylate cyclase domain-containing protein [Acuticoccus sediminis]|uniref:adenylate/guanylate cyclase domain-containing protein n=1 Tax=Acuticoccus sediminis TaxID=2184697 RepID=UPI001CFCC146|nr:adenylate/guanylate cyclase domain-containing protein [Acuticoccus sediminis]
MTTTILVVDDEPDFEALILQRFRRSVRDETFAFLFARDGVEALEVLAANPHVDLVLSDINMPRMDGLTLLERLAALDQRVFTVIVSAYGDMANIRTAMNRGAFDFLTKPLDFSDLERTIEKTMRHTRLFREAEERQRSAEQASAALSRYFSPNIAERLAAAADTLDAGERREITAVFTDITGFTPLVEVVEPAVLAQLLNAYVSGMTACVFDHQGTVAKIVGDALHILFGAPADQGDHAARAIACARDLDTLAQEFCTVWQERGVALGPTRIGVHSGPALVGSFGGGRFFDYTAYGETINIAARLEAANKAFGTRVLVSAATASAAPDFHGRPVGDLQLRGCRGPMRVFELSSRDDGDDYRAAFDRLERGDPDAVAAFAVVFGSHPDDPLASFHLKRLLNGGGGTTIVVG